MRYASLRRLAHVAGRKATARAGLAAALLLPLLACSGSISGPGPVPVATWGGSQANLSVFADSATLELPCAIARIPGRLVTSADGTFDVAGQYASQVGPVRLDGPDWQSASFTGRRDGDLLQMNVRAAGGATLGPLQLQRGVVGHLLYCL